MIPCGSQVPIASILQWDIIFFNKEYIFNLVSDHGQSKTYFIQHLNGFASDAFLYLFWSVLHMLWIRSGKRQRPWENGEDPEDVGRGGAAASLGPPSKCLPSQEDPQICSEGCAWHSLLVSLSPPLAKKLYIFINLHMSLSIWSRPWQRPRPPSLNPKFWNH